MKTLLVPVDYSNASIKALEIALNLASRADAALLLCHVYQLPAYVAEAHHPVYALPSFETKEEALKKLESVAEQVKKKSEAEVQLTCTVVVGNVVEELLELAEKSNSSLIVMGTTGRGSIENRFFGSTTKHLVKHASCPVLAVPLNAQLSLINRIVYASALEPSEAAALKQLAQVKKLFSATLTVLYVQSGKDHSKVSIDIRKNEMMKSLPDDVFTFSQIRCDDIAEGIEKFVQAYNADLVAFTVSQRGFWKNLLESSITSRLLEELNLPMLAFPQYASAAAGLLPDDQEEKQAEQPKEPVKH